MSYIDNHADKNCQSVVANTVVKGKTGNAGQEVSVFVKDGKQNKGTTVSKKCIAIGMTGEELGSATARFVSDAKVKHG